MGRQSGAARASPWPCSAYSKCPRGPNGPQAQRHSHEEEKRLLSRNQANNNTGDNNTFAFAPGAMPCPSCQQPKRINPTPRYAMRPEQSGGEKQCSKNFPWHSNHLSQRGQSSGWVGIGTFRFAKVASGSRSLVSRHFCIKLENCPPLAGSTYLVSANVRENLWDEQTLR